MDKIKIFSLIFNILFIIQIAHTQNKIDSVYIQNINRIEYCNGCPELVGALNLMLCYAEYQFPTIINNSYLFLLNFSDSTNFTATYSTYNKMFISDYFSVIDSSKQYFFYYKNILFLINYDSIAASSGLFNHNSVFYDKDLEDTLIYYVSDINNFSGTITFNIMNIENNYILMCDSRSFYRFDRKMKDIFYYKIQPSDTWENVSKELCCPIKTLQMVNGTRNKKLPKTGEIIQVLYEYENKKILDIKRIQ